MLWDKLSCFSFAQTVASTATVPAAGDTPAVVAATSSKVIDTKLNRGLDDHLRIFGMITGAPLTTGTITVDVMTSDSVASDYVKIAESTLSGNKLIDIVYPRNAKRFVKLVYTVGTTALNRAVTVWAGLLPETEVDEALKLQQLNVVSNGVNTGIEDLNVSHQTLV